ncbi:MAG: hypothetical protein U5L10_05305 [Candidatus Moranbacteria bacterium]|nr:hypothetical protein [Candidatus Moranbacteria bacterium]
MKMFLKRALIFCFLVAFSGISWAGTGNSVLTEEHFDKTMDEVKMQLGSIQGDTQNLVDLMGVVVEGSLPAGEGLISYCNSQGWNPWVIAGYNDLCPDQLDKLPAGMKLKHPQTPSQMQEALKKGRQIRREYYASKDQNVRVNKVIADTVFAKRLKTQLAQVDKLEAKVENVEESNVQLQRVNKQLVNEQHTQNAYINNLEQKLAQKPKVVTKTETVYKTVGGKEVYSAECDERPFRASGFWSTLPDGEYVELKYRPNKTQHYKAVRVLKEDGWVKPSCQRFWAQNKIEIRHLTSLVNKGENLIQKRNWSLPEGDGGRHRTYKVLKVVTQ